MSRAEASFRARLAAVLRIFVGALLVFAPPAMAQPATPVDGAEENIGPPSPTSPPKPPRRDKVFFMREGMIAFVKNDMQLAEKHLKRVLAFDPKYAPAYRVYAVI